MKARLFSTATVVLLTFVVAGCQPYKRPSTQQSKLYSNLTKPTSTVEKKTVIPFAAPKKATTMTAAEGFKGCMSEEKAQILGTVWTYIYPRFKKGIVARLKQKDGNYLYDVQKVTNNMVKAAHRCGNTTVIDQMAEMLVVAFNDDLFVDQGNYKTLFSKKGKEVEFLYLSQYFYQVVETIHTITMIPKENRTDNMRALLKAADRVLIDHYDRWIFKRKFKKSGSKDGEYQSHLPALKEYLVWSKFPDQRLNNGKDKSFYSIKDKDVWLVAGLVEILAAIDQDPESFSPEVRKLTTKYDEYINIAMQIIEMRLLSTDLKDFTGKPVKGLVFEPGFWENNGTSLYAGYTGTTYPKPSDKKKVSTLGMDMGHSIRYPHVFETFHRNRHITKTNFPDEATMKGLANQFAYGIFNHSFDRPLFSNYFDGSNGWYRVGYGGRNGFGYSPHQLSYSVVEGYFGLWATYNPDVAKVMDSIWSLFDEKDKDRKAFLESNYNCHWRDFKNKCKKRFDKKKAPVYIQFLPNFAVKPKS